ncbi:hypothetical protein PROFUN_12954 [Planoprotostelium fungivorum]|uniref:Uncharacterized protein n=1 Tax=Planoprotostelium fungivorum TaxID=1890364 RepID=A0A2P6N5Y4_9EUKA|nr:hypothetical protein PROFUN_12954 [Planoprotostelium fungivorum]
MAVPSKSNNFYSSLMSPCALLSNKTSFKHQLCGSWFESGCWDFYHPPRAHIASNIGDRDLAAEEKPPSHTSGIRSLKVAFGQHRHSLRIDRPKWMDIDFITVSAPRRMTSATEPLASWPAGGNRRRIPIPIADWIEPLEPHQADARPIEEEV